MPNKRRTRRSRDRARRRHDMRATILSVVESPDRYLLLNEVVKQDRDICMATLWAIAKKPFCMNAEGFQRILDEVFLHLPNFSDHQKLLLRLVEWRNAPAVKLYLSHFGHRIYHNWEFLKEVIEQDHHAWFFQRLPLDGRSHPEILQIVLTHAPGRDLMGFMRAIPPGVLAEQPMSFFVQAVEKDAISFDPGLVPALFWQNRDFVVKWVRMTSRIPLALVPDELSNDREICLFLYQSRCNENKVTEAAHWMSKSVLADKEFVLKCLQKHPTMWQHCEPNLQRDFDILLETAWGAILAGRFDRFTSDAGKSLVVFAYEAQRTIEAHTELMTLLACSWRSRQLQNHPLSVFDCGKDTARGLMTMVADYIGFRAERIVWRLRLVWDSLVWEIVQGGLSVSGLLPVIQPRTVAIFVIRAIQNNSRVALVTFPEELWSNRTFVIWAGRRSLFHEAIREDFFADPEICFEYYQRMPLKVVTRISNTLKSDQDFVRRCACVNPLILSYCSEDYVLYDFDILLGAARNTDMEVLLETAVVGGWAKSLVYFAASVRAKVEAMSAFEWLVVMLEKTHFSGIGADTTAVKTLIASYLGTNMFPERKDCMSDRRDLDKIWQNRSIFHLGMGGNIEDLYKVNKFRPKQHDPQWRNW